MIMKKCFHLLIFMLTDSRYFELAVSFSLQPPFAYLRLRCFLVHLDLALNLQNLHQTDADFEDLKLNPNEPENNAILNMQKAAGERKKPLIRSIESLST